MKKRRARKPVTYKKRNVVLRYKFKYERKQKVYRFAQVFTIICLAVFGSFFGYKAVSGFLFCSDCFKIRAIDIRGAKNISSSEIAALIPFREGDNIFSAPVSATEKNLRQCKPELKKLKVSRGWKKIVINFEERVPVAFTKISGERFGLDNENKPFPLRGMYARKPLPEIDSRDEAGRREVLDFIKVFAPKAKDMYPKIVRLAPEPGGCVTFVLSDGLKILWGSSGEEKIVKKLVKLDQVLFDAAERFKVVEYVNLCFFDDGRIIVKPRKTS